MFHRFLEGQSYAANAILAILSVQLTVFIISWPQLSIVAPVVITSSTNRMCFWFKISEFVTQKMDETFFHRSDLDFLV
jgi:hypothetical protein